MKNILQALIIWVVGGIALAGCHHVEEWDNDARGNFDALWTILDTHYCFFEEKGIDWDSIYQVYSAQINDETTYTGLYSICAEMLNSLQDGHVNLTTPFATSYYKKWWSDYPQNYSERLVDEYYLHFGGLTRGGITYAMFPDSIGYMRIPTFAGGVSESTLDWAFLLLGKCHGLVIDIRDNGGGDISAVQTIVSRLIDSRILAGYICHKSGPGHADFSEPYAYYFDPADEGRVRWSKPVAVLQNRSTFSAANNFVSVVRNLPDVTLVGDCTGGGSGMPFSSEIPVGWSVRFSASPVFDSQMRSTENGCPPDIYVNLDPDSALVGVDTMLDAAIEALIKKHQK